VLRLASASLLSFLSYIKAAVNPCLTVLISLIKLLYADVDSSASATSSFKLSLIAVYKSSNYDITFAKAPWSIEVAN